MTCDQQLQRRWDVDIIRKMLTRCRWFPQSSQAHNDIAPDSQHPILLSNPYGYSPFMSSTSIYSSWPLINYQKEKRRKKKKKMKRMKKIDLLLRKCKSLSRQLGRSSSYSSLRSKSTREDMWGGMHGEAEEEQREPILVGSSRRRYMISSKYLNHPLLNALIDKSKQSPGEAVLVKCEVVLFDHLLWMLDSGDPNLSTSESLEELVDLYVL